MSLKICVFGSGSTGNCTFVRSQTSTLLVDLGLPAVRVEKCLRALGVEQKEISVLLTHAHSDHIGGLISFCRRNPDTKVYCHRDCAPSIRKRVGSLPLIVTDGDFYIGDVTVSPFAVSHDVPCVGYGLMSGGKKIALATDIGSVPAALLDGLADSDLVVLESNHDETLVRNNASYPPALKSRILSSHGHLSNYACAECVAYLAGHGVKQVVLAHLSRENNYPELAFETCKNALRARGLLEGKDIRLEVAYADKMSGLFEIV